MQRLAFPGVITFFLACGVSVKAPVATIPAASSPPSAPSFAGASTPSVGRTVPSNGWVPFVDRPQDPDSVKSTLSVPNDATLRAISATEARVLMPIGSERFDAIDRLRDHCIVHVEPEGDVALRGVQPDAQLLFSSEGEANLENRVQSKKRFPEDHEDAEFAMTSDGKTLVVLVNQRPYLSTTGGKYFQRVEDEPATRLALAADGKFFAVVRSKRDGKGSVTTYRIQADASVLVSLPAQLDENVTWLGVSPKGPMFAHLGDRCVHRVRWDTGAREQAFCIHPKGLAKDAPFNVQLSPDGKFLRSIDGDFQNTSGALRSTDDGTVLYPLPSVYELHNYSFGPDNQARFGWDWKLALHVASTKGVKRMPWKQPALDWSPLGFVGDGVLWFHRLPGPVPKTRPNVRSVAQATELLSAHLCDLFTIEPIPN
jgi:hypothetical protein